MSDKKLQTTGYRLHARRLNYNNSRTGNLLSTTKSFKYPITSKKQTTDDELFNLIKNNYQRNVGKSYNNYTENQYTLLDFWVDLLRVGIVTASSNTTLTGVAENLGYRKKVFDNIPAIFIEKLQLDKTDLVDNYNEVITKEFIKPFLVSTGFRNKINADLLKGYFIKLFKKGRFPEDKFKVIVDELLKLKSSKLYGAYWLKKLGITLNVNVNSVYLFDLNLPFSPDAKVEDLLEKYRKFYIDDKKIHEFLLSGKNYNAYDRIFGEYLNNFVEGKYLNEFERIKSFYSNEMHVELKNRLKFLSKRAQLLDKQTYGDIARKSFRSDLLGKISSFVTNYFKRKVELEEYYRDYKKDLTLLLDNGYLKKYLDNLEVKVKNDEYSKYIKNNSSFEQVWQFTVENVSINSENFDLFSSLTSDLRYQLNQLCPRENLNEEDSKPFDLKHIFENIPKIVSFIGISRDEKFKIENNAAKKLNECVSNIKNLHGLLSSSKVNNLCDKDITYFLQRLKSAYHSFQDIETRHIFENLFKKYFIEFKETLNDENRVFYKYKKSRNKKLIIEQLTKENLNSVFENFYFELRSWVLDQYENKFFTNKRNKLNRHFDIIQLDRTIMSIYMKATEIENLKLLESTTYNFLLSANNYVKFRKWEINDEIPIKDISSFVQKYYYTEARGALNRISKEKFIKRYVMNYIGIHNDYVLCRNTSNGKFGYLNPQKAKKTRQNNIKLFTNIIDKKKNLKLLDAWIDNLNENEKGEIQNYNFFEINTSKYQLIGLNRVAKKPRKKSIWEMIDFKVSPPMLIAEEEVRSEWDLESLTCTYTVNENSKKLFASNPFQFIIAKQKAELEVQNYLGIDTGEYGLAYSVLSQDQNNIIIKKQGFIFNNNLRKIKDRFEDLKMNSRTGTFNQASTKLADVRENAINSINNEVNYLTLTYKAKPVFEWQISAFETGGNKVSKIYNSIKKPNVSPKIKADESIVLSKWGNKSPIGSEVSAIGTSQTCICCKSNIYEFKKKYRSLKNQTINDDFEFKAVHKSIFSVKEKVCPDRIFYIYSEKDISNKTCYEDIVNGITNFQRPPINSTESSAVLDFLKSKDNAKANELRNYIVQNRNRGNSFIFTCPFCLNWADADLQASIVIAIRGKFEDGEPKRKKGEKLTEDEKIDKENRYKKFFKNLNIKY